MVDFYLKPSELSLNTFINYYFFVSFYGDVKEYIYVCRLGIQYEFRAAKCK